MSSVTVTLTAVCTGGNHLTFTSTGDVAGVKSVVELDNLSQPVTQEDVDSFVKVIAKLAKMGRTVAQAKTLLQAGVVLVV